MRNATKTAIAALVAVLCMSAAITSNAFATEGKGELVNSKGQALVKNKIKGTTVGAPYILVEGDTIGRCEAGTIAGSITSTKAGTGTLTLTDCQGYLGAKCKTKGAATGEWVLPLTLNITPDGSTADGIEAHVTETEIGCAAVGVTMKIRGALLLQAPLHALRSEYTLYTSGTAAEPLQIEQSDTGGAGFQNASITLELKSKFEETAEFI